MIHGHEVLEMMFDNSYSSREELVNAIINKFGADERFYTCSAENMTAAELVAFLEAKGKFMPAGSEGFTADRSKMCNHWNMVLDHPTEAGYLVYEEDNQ